MKLNPAKPVPHKISLASGVKKNGKYYMSYKIGSVPRGTMYTQ
jgi:hypothetical protein